MALPGLFPIYPDPAPMKYQVSLSMPSSGNSEISKSIGITSSSLFLVPNIDYLQKFISGDLGIADKMSKQSLYKNLNSPQIQNEKTFNKFTKLNGIDINPSKYKKNGKINVPKSDISVPPSEGVGFKGFEKTLLTSIFETQKPYFEVIKLVIGNIAKIEDIIARSMPLLGVPGKTKSLKPSSNAGAGNRPKAIGYQGGKELKDGLAKLQALSKQGSTVTIDKNGNAIRENVKGVTASLGAGDNKNWRIVSSVYSTGYYIPGVDYLYTYIDLPPEPIEPVENVDLNLEDDDPYNKYKPERIILGIFKNDGTPLDPNEYLNEIDINGKVVKSQYKRADWIFRSPKWVLPPAIWAWPSIGSPIYKWELPGLPPKDSKDSPGDAWKIKKYRKGQKNLLSGDDAIEGDPMIVGFETLEVSNYINYFTDTVTYKMNQSDLEPEEKVTYTKEIMSRFQAQSHLSNVYQYGQMKSSVYKPVNGDPAYPIELNFSFRPYQIYSAAASKDIKLSAYNKSKGQIPGMIWVDPESDYDMKVIRIDPTTKKDIVIPQGTPTIQVNLATGISSQANFTAGGVIDVSKILNDDLTTSESFSKGKYGVGDEDDPQEIEIIKRYMLTNLDTESYYLIEGILAEKNTQTGNTSPGTAPGSGGSYYRLPQALGAVKIFLSLLVDIFAKLIPLLTKLISLFKKPASFVFEVIKEKMGDGFSIFSGESFRTFNRAKDEAPKHDRPSDKSNKIRNIFKQSPLSNHVFVDKKGDYKFLLDGIAMLPFSIFGKQIPFGMEMNFSNSNDPIKLVTPKELPSSKVKNLQSFLKPAIKDFKGPGSDGRAAPLNISDIKSANSPIYKSTDPKINNPNDYEIVSVVYSTGSYIAGVDYNYIYLTQDTNNLLKEANDILQTNDEAVDLPTARKTLEDLDNAIKKDPTDTALKDMAKRLKDKINGLDDNTQPLLKMLLGFVTLPIKIIAGMLEWLLDFFKSLTNPLKLPSQIGQLLSFSWVTDLISPKGILELAGIKLDPSVITKWSSLVKVPNLNPPVKTTNIPTGFDLSKATYKNASPKGKYLVPDDHEIADLNLMMGIPFMSKLPTYTASQFRNNPDRPLGLFFPVLCLFENIINGIIDFIWSILGIEALVKPPHIKLCSNSSNPDVNDAIKIVSDIENKSDPSDKEGANGDPKTGGEPNDVPAGSGFLYDITLDDGTVVQGLNYEELQKYIKDHEDITYDFKF